MKGEDSVGNRALRITRIKKLFGASLSKERIGIYLKIDGKIPELFTPIGQDEVCPDGTVIKNDPIRLLPRIDNGESYLVRIPEGEHILSVDNYAKHAEIKISPACNAVFCWYDEKGVHVSTRRPIPSWIKFCIILVVFVYGLSFLISVLNLLLL